MSESETKVMSKVEIAYRTIADWIVFQDLAPGSVLSENQLMEMTSLGRTPIREALQRLALEHLVEIHPFRGTFVRNISAEDQLKSLEVRGPLEMLTAELAAKRRTNHDIHEITILIDKLEKFYSDDPREFGGLLSEAHHVVASAARNEYLSSMISSIHGPSRRFWFANIKDLTRELKNGAVHHTLILNAIREGNSENAKREAKKLHNYLLEFTYQAIRE